MKTHQIIKNDNETNKRLYPNGINHRGTKLAWYTVGGHKIWAINLDQAKNIYHQARIDAE